jgi:hypothetical protein
MFGLKFKILKFPVFFILFSISVFSQNAEEKRIILGNRYAEIELKKALNEKPKSIVVGLDNHKTLLNDSIVALQKAEEILFSFYGKYMIQKQKPYSIYFINKYWIIYGRYSEKFPNDAFLIILDKENSNVLKIVSDRYRK